MPERPGSDPARDGGRGLIGAGLAILTVLALAALFAPGLTSHSPAEQIDTVGGRYLPPGTTATELRFASGRSWLVTGLEIGSTRIIAERGGRRVEAERDELVDFDPGAKPATHFFPLGTDRLGRDCWSRLLHAGRISLLVGVSAAALSALLGLLVGTAAGAVGGWVDALLMRTADAFLAFPRLFLVLAASALLDAGTTAVVLVLGSTGWMGVSRLVRGEVRKLSRQDFVAAAQSVGSGPLTIAARHLVRNAMTPLITWTALRVGNVILIEAALSYLGLGIKPPRPTWGNMIYDGWTDLATAWWPSVFPGLAIAATVIAFNLVGDGLRDRWDPRAAGV